VFLENKKMKDKDKFRRYVMIFIREVENGELKKRLGKERIEEVNL